MCCLWLTPKYYSYRNVMKSFRRSIKAAKGFKWTHTGLIMDFLLDFLKKKKRKRFR